MSVTDEASPARLAVSALFIYPIKSCRGLSVSRAIVTDRGFEGDRRYMLVDRQGEFVTGRSQRRLCLVDVELHSAGLLVSLAGADRELLPREPQGPELSVRVWGSSVEALEVPAGSRWFSEILGDDLRLVYMPDSSKRPLKGQTPGSGIVSFADGFPFLLLSEASLVELNRRCPEPMRIERFRPNIVVSGGAPHVEDELSLFRVGSVSFFGPKLCDRCVVTTLDPESANPGKEPLRTLASYRQWDKKVWFGMNLSHQGEGTIALGDSLVIPKR
jgi:uncharacterized protein YcbX